VTSIKQIFIAKLKIALIRLEGGDRAEEIRFQKLLLYTLAIWPTTWTNEVWLWCGRFKFSFKHC